MERKQQESKEGMGEKMERKQIDFFFEKTAIVSRKKKP